MPAFESRDLFDPDFLQSLSRLHLRAKRVAAGGRHAEQRSRDMGAGIEFKDFRPYTPGDDFRAIDWTIYQRLGRVFLRLFEEQEDLPVYLMPDISRSLFLETPPRARTGLRTALAMASIALNQHDSVGLFPFSDQLQILLRPQAGSGRIMRFASALAGLEMGGTTNLTGSLRKLESLRLRSGLLVVISDFFEPNGLDAALKQLGRMRHKLLLVQLIRKSDRDPQLQGDYELVDCETGQAASVSITPTIRDRYRKAYGAFETNVTEFARKRGAGLIQMDVEKDILPQLSELFETGSYVV
jgi:uncharacterized protein (DUF58 family)